MKNVLKNGYVLFGGVVLVKIVLDIALGLLLDHCFSISSEEKGGLKFNSSIEEFITVVVLVPPIETLLFQVLPIRLILKYLKSSLLAIFVSTVLFTSIHNFSWAYMIMIFPTALIYAAYYTYVFKKEGGIMAFLFVCMAHFFNNLLVFTVSFMD